MKFLIKGRTGDYDFGPFTWIDLDEKFGEALHFVLGQKQITTTSLCKKLHIGYARSSRILEYFETTGVVGPMKGNIPRDVLVRTMKEFFRNNQGKIKVTE